jgi:hypothetical protein
MLAKVKQADHLGGGQHRHRVLFGAILTGWTVAIASDSTPNSAVGAAEL